MILSVIIPCYNCAPVIQRCLDSIDYPDAEIIVVDDGSSDDSAKVVGDYAKNHAGVRLLQKANGGVSSARNMGIDAATGKYIMFVDADDFVLPHSIEKAVGMIEQSGVDVLKFSYHTVAEGAAQHFGEEDARPVSTEIIKGRYEALKRNDVPDYLVWDGIYRRDLITDNHIRFHTDLEARGRGRTWCRAGSSTRRIWPPPLRRARRARAAASEPAPRRPAGRRDRA